MASPMNYNSMKKAMKIEKPKPERMRKQEEEPKKTAGGKGMQKKKKEESFNTKIDTKVDKKVKAKKPAATKVSKAQLVARAHAYNKKVMIDKPAKMKKEALRQALDKKGA